MFQDPMMDNLAPPPLPVPMEQPIQEPDFLDEDFDYEGYDSEEPLEGELQESLPPIEEIGFYGNLSPYLPKGVRAKLATQILEDIEDDIESRKKWESSISLMMTYAGLTVEEFRSIPFFMACAAFDSTLTAAWQRISASIFNELYPAEGPVKSLIRGMATEELEDKAFRTKTYSNSYLTDIDADYYDDSEQMISEVVFKGHAFKKVVKSSSTSMPESRFIKPEDLIVNNQRKSLLSSTRITHRYWVTRKEFLLKQQMGIFDPTIKLPFSAEEEEDLSMIDKKIQIIEGVEVEDSEESNLFCMKECHIELSSEHFEKLTGQKDEEAMPQPYIVTILECTKEAVSICRNWREADDKFKRIECFVDFKFLNGFGFYGVGLAQLIGSNSITQTSILRQLIDAGTLKNFPGGIKTKGARSENNNIIPGPGGWLEIETGQASIRDSLMLMPYEEPSQVLVGLLATLKQESLASVGAAEQNIVTQGGETPVGTMLQMIEVSTRLQTKAMKSLHKSLRKEFKMIYELFRDCLPDEPYPFLVPGGEGVLMREDFHDKISIVPVSDPNVLTRTHRVLIEEAKLKLAQSAPELHNMREVYRGFYAAMGVADIEAILSPEPKPQALDAVSENMSLFQNQPIAVGMYQDHPSHRFIHKRDIGRVLADPNLMGLNPQYVMKMIMHNQVHLACEVVQGFLQEDPYFLKKAEQTLGKEIEDPSELLMIPEIQNEVTRRDAEEQQQMAEQEQQQAEQAHQEQLMPTQVMLQDIDQRREAAHLKSEEVLETNEKDRELSAEQAEVEAFKSQLKFESEMAKTEANREMAVEKNETAVTVEEMKHQPYPGEIE